MHHLRPSATHQIVEDDRTDKARLELRAAFTEVFNRYKGTGHRVSNNKETGIYTPAQYEAFRVVGRTVLYNDLTDTKRVKLIMGEPVAGLLTGEHLKEMRGVGAKESLVNYMLPQELELHIELLNRTRLALEPMKHGSKIKAIRVVVAIAEELRAEFKRRNDGQGPEFFAGASPIGEARKRVRVRDRKSQTAAGQFLLSLTRKPFSRARKEETPVAEPLGCPCLGYTL